MAGPSEAAKEPTMEEILASIRRIISEDDGAREQPDEVTAAADEPEEVEEFVEEPVEEVVAEATPFTEPETEAPEVTEATAEERETSNPDDERYASIASVFAGRRPVTVEDEDDDEYYEEDEEDDDFEMEAETARVSAFQPEVVSDNTVFRNDEEDEGALDEPVAFGSDVPTEPEWSQSDYQPETSPVASFTQDADFEEAVDDELETLVEDELLSPSTQNQVANMLGQLSQGVAREETPREPATGGSTSVEGMVREMLRPMLQQWLDQNLPGMVERMVEREIRRVTRGR